MWNNNDSTMRNEDGYMDTSANDTMSTENKFKNLKTGQNCVPLMIAHLNRYGEDLSVWGMPVRIITFLAIVRKIEAASTRVTFEFEDETGTIKGIQWLEGTKISYESPVDINKYAQVHGVMRNKNNRKFVLVSNIQPMEHLNELLTHLMEVTLVALEGNENVSTGVQSDEIFVRNSTSMPGPSTSKMTNNLPGLNEQYSMILNIIKNSLEPGAYRDDIKTKLPEIASKVDELLKFLEDEGQVYTTVTDNHFKMT